MKEIKFRSWSKDNKKMLYGNDLQGRIFFGNDGVGTIGTSFTLMQLTGLKDRKGKEIWEGDVVEYTYETYSGENSVVGVVSFDGEQFGLELSSQWIPIAGKDSEDFEVKGNAYENPNLISKNN